MSRWGTFPCYLSGELVYHIAPCDKSGLILPEHVALTECQCKPRQDTEARQLWIHNDRERGGTNA